MLLGSGLVRQPEVVVTRSLGRLCSLPGAWPAMNALIAGAGLEPGENPSWYADVRAASGAQTDLECWWGEPPLPRVVVEAKIGAPLATGQIADYIADLTRRVSGGDHDASWWFWCRRTGAAKQRSSLTRHCRCVANRQSVRPYGATTTCSVRSWTCYRARVISSNCAGSWKPVRHWTLSRSLRMSWQLVRRTGEPTWPGCWTRPRCHSSHQASVCCPQVATRTFRAGVTSKSLPAGRTSR
jgi:hypothetical protein